MYTENLKANNVMLWAVNTEKINDEIKAAVKIYKERGICDELKRKIVWVRSISESSLQRDFHRRGERYEFMNDDDDKDFFVTLLDYIRCSCD